MTACPACRAPAAPPAVVGDRGASAVTAAVKNSAISPSAETKPVPDQTKTVLVSDIEKIPLKGEKTKTVSDAPIGCLGALDIPYALRRSRDGTLMYPELRACAMNTSAPSAVSTTDTRTFDVTDPTALTAVTDADLNALLSDHTLTVEQRQPIYREAHRREDRVKARARIEKMKAAMAAKEAAKKDASCGPTEQLPPA